MMARRVSDGVALTGPAHSASGSGTAAGPGAGRGFGSLLGTAAAEGFGDALARTVLPILAVAVLGMGPAFVGALNAVGVAAFLLLGVPAGAAIDRRRRPLSAMGAASLLRSLVLLGLAAAVFTGALSAPVLAAAAVLIGVADVVFTTAQTSVVPGVAGKRGLKHVYSRLAITGQASSAAAAGTAGAVLALVGMPLLLAATAAAYAASRVFQLGLPRRSDEATGPGMRDSRATRDGRAAKDNGSAADPGAPRRRIRSRLRPRGEWRRGFALLRASPALSALTLSACLTNAAAMVGNTVLPVYVLQDLAVSPAAYAALGMFAALGAVLGAAAAPGISGWLGLRATRASAALLSVPTVLVAVGCTWLPGPETAWLAVEFFLWAFLISLSGVAGSEVLPRTVAADQLATVAAAQRTFSLGVMPVAAVVAGCVGAWLGTAPVFCLWLLLAAAAAVPIVRARALDQFR